MQHVKEEIAKIGKSDFIHNKPVCFFCDSFIETGEKIVSRKESGFYHRKCYDFLFTLKSSSINFEYKTHHTS